MGYCNFLAQGGKLLAVFGDLVLPNLNIILIQIFKLTFASSTIEIQIAYLLPDRLLHQGIIKLTARWPISRSNFWHKQGGRKFLAQIDDLVLSMNPPNLNVYTQGVERHARYHIGKILAT